MISILIVSFFALSIFLFSSCTFSLSWLSNHNKFNIPWILHPSLRHSEIGSCVEREGKWDGKLGMKKGEKSEGKTENHFPLRLCDWRQTSHKFKRTSREQSNTKGWCVALFNSYPVIVNFILGKKKPSIECWR